MNQTFNLDRFGLVLKLDLAEKGKNNLSMATLLAGVMALMMVPVSTSTTYSAVLEGLHYIALFMILLFGSSLYTSTVFTSYSAQSTGMAAIMIPASRLEKFLSALLLNLLFIVPFLLLYFKLHFSMLDIANAKLGPGRRYNALPDDLVRYICFSYMLIQGCVFLGSIYFQKLSYIKTASTVICFFVFLSIVQITMANYLTAIPNTTLPSKVVTFPLSSWKIWYFETGFSFFNINFPESFQVAVYAFPVLALLSLWGIAYLRLAEKEI